MDRSAQVASDTVPVPEPTRLIAMGSEALMDGFQLIGFETYPEACTEDLETVLGGLVAQRGKALVMLEEYLIRCDSPILEQVRNRGGRIIVCLIPQLHAPEHYRPPVEELVARVLGPAALEERR